MVFHVKGYIMLILDLHTFILYYNPIGDNGGVYLRDLFDRFLITMIDELYSFKNNLLRKKY